jgi:uncharacterized protein YjiS (DUF1127 family)
MSGEHKFIAFLFDTKVCNVCGELRDDHVEQASPYAGHIEPMWRAMIRHGGDPSIYSGYSWRSTMEVRAHLGMLSDENLREIHEWEKNSGRKFPIPDKPCAIDFKRTSDPEDGTVGVFNGTFTENGEEYAVTGYLYCKCEEVEDQDWALRKKTLSQLIWMVCNEEA